jgi:hypothetical protein
VSKGRKNNVLPSVLALRFDDEEDALNISGILFFGVEKSQSLTLTWILWAKQYCSRDPDTEISDEVRQVYDFYRKFIDPDNRKEGRRVVAALLLVRSKQAEGSSDWKR